MTRKNWIVLGVLATLAFLGVIVFSSMGLRQHRVEVCMSWEGRTQCRQASGPTRDEAIRTAADNACALLTSGMTNTMTCGRLNPVSVKDLK